MVGVVTFRRHGWSGRRDHRPTGRAGRPAGEPGGEPGSSSGFSRCLIAASTMPQPACPMTTTSFMPDPDTVFHARDHLDGRNAGHPRTIRVPGLVEHDLRSDPRIDATDDAGDGGLAGGEGGPCLGRIRRGAATVDVPAVALKKHLDDLVWRVGSVHWSSRIGCGQEVLVGILTPGCRNGGATARCMVVPGLDPMPPIRGLGRSPPPGTNRVGNRRGRFRPRRCR